MRLVRVRRRFRLFGTPGQERRLACLFYGISRSQSLWIHAKKFPRRCRRVFCWRKITVKGISVQPGFFNEYLLRKLSAGLPLNAEWDDPSWAAAETAQITHFRPESSGHRPQTFVRLLYDSAGVHGIFKVQDQYVRCIRTNYFDEVWKDSCVEFFVEPKAGRGYFNFEFNGAFLCSHITNPERGPAGLKQFTRVPSEIGETVQVRASLPRLIEKEISDPTIWTLQFYIPLKVLERYVGALGSLAGQTWRGNFFKCAEEVSHPHWASWSPVDEFNFHLPRCFGLVQFVG
jgi:hypothetical protein